MCCFLLVVLDLQLLSCEKSGLAVSDLCEVCDLVASLRTQCGRLGLPYLVPLNHLRPDRTNQSSVKVGGLFVSLSGLVMGPLLALRVAASAMQPTIPCAPKTVTTQVKNVS
jgi:hypothetical protein